MVFVLVAGLGLAIPLASAAAQSCATRLDVGQAAALAGDLAVAEAAFTGAAAQAEVDGMPDCRAEALAELSRTLESAGRIEAAATVLEDRLAVRRSDLELSRSDLALDLYSAAGFYMEHGQPNEAATHLEAVLLVDIGVFGPEHPLIGDGLLFLALLYEEAGRVVDARRSYEGALLVYEKIFPADHADLGRALSGYAALLAQIGEVELAADFAARAAATNFVQAEE